MKQWIMSASPLIYDHMRAFQKNGYIDWHQTRNFEPGDIVYIYCSKGVSRVQFLTCVEKVNITEAPEDAEFWKIKDIPVKKKYFRLRLLKYVDKEELSLKNLKENGMKYAPQSPCVLTDQLAEYLGNYFKGDE